MVFYTSQEVKKCSLSVCIKTTPKPARAHILISSRIEKANLPKGRDAKPRGLKYQYYDSPVAEVIRW